MNESNIKVSKTKFIMPALICLTIWAIPLLFPTVGTSLGITGLQAFIVGLIAFVLGSAKVLISGNPEQRKSDHKI